MELNGIGPLLNEPSYICELNPPTEKSILDIHPLVCSHKVHSVRVQMNWKTIFEYPLSMYKVVSVRCMEVILSNKLFSNLSNFYFNRFDNFNTFHILVFVRLILPYKLSREHITTTAFLYQSNYVSGHLTYCIDMDLLWSASLSGTLYLKINFTSSRNHFLNVCIVISLI